MRTPVLAALVFSHLLCPPPATPETAGQPAFVYRDLVDAYRSNGSAEVEQALNAPSDAIERSVEAALAPDSGWTWEEIRGAAMLHSEVAIRALRMKSARAADLHLSLAERLLDRTVRLSRPQEDFAWRWYMAMPAVISQLGSQLGSQRESQLGSQLGRPDIVDRLEGRASKNWPEDSARHSFLHGLSFERRAAREPRVSAPGQSTRTRIGGTWSAAARMYEQALRDDPSLHAAALHLGRVKMLHGQHLEAAPLFRSARAAVNPAVAYLATLYLGSLDERAGRFDAAEVLYRDALARFPYGQAAPLALAQLLSRTGRERDARAVLAARVLRPGAFLIEPMWVYGLPYEDPGMQIDLLRVEVWK